MTADPAPASPARPSLVQADNKPDVLVRLTTWRDSLAGTVYADTREMVADAIDTITGLRAANQRHCDDERLLKAIRAILRSDVTSSDMLDEIEALLNPPAARATETQP